MLKTLYIRNYAIIDEVKLEFDEGFNVITGETGAGKSILLGALGLILGNRADTKVLYNQDQKCIVEATFSKLSKSLKSQLESEDYDIDDDVVIRREINNKGKSRAFINDTPVILTDIKNVASTLVDIHNQFDTLSITTQEYQREIIDAYSGAENKLTNYQKEYDRYIHFKSELKRLYASQSKGQKDQDYLLYQLEELNKIPLDELNKTALEEEYTTLSNSEEIQKILGQLRHELTENELSIESRMIDLNRELSSLSEYSKPLSQLGERMESIIESIQDIERESSSIADTIENDPQRVLELKETLDQIYFLEQKHSIEGIEALIRLRQELEDRTGGTIDLEKQILKTEKLLEESKKELWNKAELLTQQRLSCKDKLQNNIEKSLRDLAIPNAQIQLVIKELPDFEVHGLDYIDLQFSSNKGINPQSIEGTASGGELSRLALSVKSLMAGHSKVPTMIFDEIDSGISGAVALQLSNILNEMSSQHQVICITHSPQVAASQGKHFFIYKKDTSERTITHVSVLDENERVEEIAKMLSTNPPSTAAIANAKELLKAI